MKTSEAAVLLKDIELLIGAHDRVIAAKKRIRALYPSEHEQISDAPSFVAWIYFKGFTTDEQVFGFVKNAWDDFKRDKSQLWVLGRDGDDLEPEAERLLDRIDMAMGLIAQRAMTAMPVQSVRESGWHPEQHLRRIRAFAQAATDLE